MHPMSHMIMQEFKRKYIQNKKIKILDFGGANVNGSYKDIFMEQDYMTLDLIGTGADIEVDGYNWAVDDNEFDVIISGQTFEHDKFFWLTLDNFKRTLKCGGYLCIIAPSAGPEHRYPIDCYRFYKDSMPSFAEWMNMELLESRIYPKPPWNDIVGIFKKP